MSQHEIARLEAEAWARYGQWRLHEQMPKFFNQPEVLR